MLITVFCDTDASAARCHIPTQEFGASDSTITALSTSNIFCISLISRNDVSAVLE
jgi:hypothetical protein